MFRLPAAPRLVPVVLCATLVATVLVAAGCGKPSGGANAPPDDALRSPEQAADLIRRFNFRPNLCLRTHLAVGDVQLGQPESRILIENRTDPTTVYPVRARITGTCVAGVVGHEVDSSDIEIGMETSFYRSRFGEWSHTAVGGAGCRQHRVTYTLGDGGPQVDPNTGSGLCWITSDDHVQ